MCLQQALRWADALQTCSLAKVCSQAWPGPLWTPRRTLTTRSARLLRHRSLTGLNPLAAETSKQLAEACPAAGVKRQLCTGNSSLPSSSASAPNEAIR
jgi:hypothetical protein